MQSQDHKAEIAALEAQLLHYEKLLDESIENNQQLAETKIIYHEIGITKIN